MPEHLVDMTHRTLVPRIGVWDGGPPWWSREWPRVNLQRPVVSQCKIEEDPRRALCYLCFYSGQVHSIGASEKRMSDLSQHPRGGRWFAGPQSKTQEAEGCSGTQDTFPEQILYLGISLQISTMSNIAITFLVYFWFIKLDCCKANDSFFPKCFTSLTGPALLPHYLLWSFWANWGRHPNSGQWCHQRGRDLSLSLNLSERLVWWNARTQILDHHIKYTHSTTWLDFKNWIAAMLINVFTFKTDTFDFFFRIQVSGLLVSSFCR